MQRENASMGAEKMVSAMKDSKNTSPEKKDDGKAANSKSRGKPHPSDKLKHHDFETLEENLERERFNHPLESK